MDASVLESAKAAEASLRREEIKRTIEDIPKDHPLQQAIKENRLQASDLADLPDQHPLLQALKAAKERYDLNEARKDEQARTAEIKKAKRIERKQVRQAEREREAIQRSTAASAADIVNERIDHTSDAVKALIGALEDGMESLRAMPEARMKVMRLERLANAMLSGLASSRLKVRRA
ncbi:MAG: hypothetical protein DRG83_16130 [Deltaproteobacteria bacterium]|nr:MAG: hypothetical protein DRG83_16130 [Deltaproteobacteria bacterium]